MKYCFGLEENDISLKLKDDTRTLNNVLGHLVAFIKTMDGQYFPGFTNRLIEILKK